MGRKEGDRCCRDGCQDLPRPEANPRRLAMIEAPPNHPTAEELQALSLGQLPEAELAPILAHLGDCPACCQRIDQLATADPLLARLQQRAASTEEVLVSPTQRRAAVRALRQAHVMVSGTLC